MDNDGKENHEVDINYLSLRKLDLSYTSKMDQ